MRHNGDTGRADSARTAPYLPFATFLSGIERLAPEAPEVIDKTIFSSFSGTAQSQIVGALRFLGLIDAQNRTQAVLETIVSDPNSRKDLLAVSLREAYADVFAIGLQKASPKQLDEAMENYNVYGATHRKAVSFFVKAAQYAGVPLSAFIVSRKGRSGRRKTVGRNRPGESATGSVVASAVNDALMKDGTLQSKTVGLKSGGDITLSVKFDPFAISQEDRAFIFDFIDRLSRYERSKEQPKKDSATQPEDAFGGLGVTDDDVPF